MWAHRGGPGTNMLDVGAADTALWPADVELFGPAPTYWQAKGKRRPGGFHRKKWRRSDRACRIRGYPPRLALCVAVAATEATSRPRSVRRRLSPGDEH